MPPGHPIPTDALVRLPPERRQHNDGGIVLNAGCCCCCCCCLHTIGGVIGAACAGNFRAKPRRAPEDEDAEFDYDPDEYSDPPRSLAGSQGLFWSSVLIVILIQVVVAGVWQPQDFQSVLLGSGIALVMLGPLYLFAACVVMAIRIGLSPTLRRHPGYFQSALRIFGIAFLGAAIGTGVMIGLLALISISK